MISKDISFKAISYIFINTNLTFRRLKIVFSLKEKNNFNKNENLNALTNKVIISKLNYIIINLFIFASLHKTTKKNNFYYKRK